MDGPSGQRRQGPGAAWADLGTTAASTLESAELLLVELPFLAPVATSAGTHRSRPLVLVRLRCRGADGRPVDGWGECAALADTTYDREDAAGAFEHLERVLLPELVGTGPARPLVPVGTVGELPGAAGHPLASAALEMAVADAHLRGARTSFAELLGVAGCRVTPGAVLGLPRSSSRLAADLGRLWDEGYARVKVKVAPGTEAEIEAAVDDVAPTGLLVQLDANGAYGDDAAERLARLDRLGLACIEQPLGRADLEGHRRLAASLATPLCLDESLDSPVSVVEAVGAGACSVVCVKPSRLGGIGAALEVVAWCVGAGVPWWVGGMFESGYARGVNRTLAALPGSSLPGDLAPPSTYLASDLVDPVPTEIDDATGRLVCPVPSGPGLGPAPRDARVDDLAVRRAVLAADGG